MEQPGRVKIPAGAPSIRDWYVERVEVAAQICHHLGIEGNHGLPFFPEEQPRMVGLAGPGGAGKSTVASMVVTQVDVQAFFHGRVLWLSVGKGAKDRLPALMFELANRVREAVLMKAARRPREATVGINPEDGAAYIREEVGKAGRRFLVVADDVWDAEVLGELKRAGAWVIYTTRKTELFPQTPALRLEEVLEEEAETVLRRAADLGEQARLPPAAYELMKRCDFAVLDLALVGRWGNVRKRSCERAWRAALDSIIETQSAGGDGVQRLPWRAAVLRAGLGVLASDNPQTTELYYALALLPTGLAFPSEVALILLYGDDFSESALKAAEAVLGTLERLSILTLEENSGWYHVHENHVDFVLDRPLSKHYTRDTALPRWRRYISSVRALNAYSSAWLDKVWEKLAKVEGEGFVRCPYNAALSAIMDDSGGELLEALRRAAEFHFCRGDWSEAFDKYSELLVIKEQTAGPEHPDVAHILHNLGMCACEAAGREKETEGYLRRALAIQEEKLDPDDPNIASTLHSLGVYIRKTGKIDEAEGLIRRALGIRKGRLGADPLVLGRTLHSLGVCAYDAVRLEEAEDLLRQALATREGVLGTVHLEVADTLHVLGGCALKAGRMEDADKLYLRALVIREEKLGTDHPDVSQTLRNLGICSVHKARLSEEIAAGVVRRTLAIV
ncbi:unnamed protein product [Ectocarpus fasciculatus]